MESLKGLHHHLDPRGEPVDRVDVPLDQFQMHLGQEHVADYTIGWRPRAKLVRGAVRPGILGVFQAEHNLLVRFHAFPHVANLAIAQPTTLRLTGGRRPFGDRSMASVHIKASPEGALRRFARPILGGAPMFFVVRSVQG